MNELGVFLVTELELLVILCLVLCPIVYAVDSFGFLTYKSVVSFGVGCYVWSTLIAPLPTQPSFMGDPTLASVSGTILFPLPSSGYCPSVAYAIGYMMKQGLPVATPPLIAPTTPRESIKDKRKIDGEAAPSSGPIRIANSKTSGCRSTPSS